jgi:AraC-like DNA-binding protein
MKTNWQGIKCFIGSAAQGPSGNQAAPLKWVAEVEPSELFVFKECQDLFRKRLRGPMLRLIPQLTGLRLHVLWHRPMDFQGPGERPVLCPMARQRAGANGRQPKCCQFCLQRRWKPALSPANQGRRFIGQCGATNFCACLQVDKVCPLTLVLQARVAPRAPSPLTSWERRRPASQSGAENRNSPARRQRSQELCPGSAAQCVIGIQQELFPSHGLTAFGVHPSGCLPPVNTLKRGHQTRLEPVSPAAFHHAVALARLILHDLESTAQARMAGSGLENALRRLNNTQTEATRLRGELRHRLPDLPESTVQPGLGSHAQKLVEGMFDYVHQHGHRPISLDELASAMKMNASYLSALFSQTTGVTFHQFLEEVRLSKARELLRDPRNRVSEVADAEGYASPDSFRHAFKAHEGLSPEAWRAGQ